MHLNLSGGIKFGALIALVTFLGACASSGDMSAQSATSEGPSDTVAAAEGTEAQMAEAAPPALDPVECKRITQTGTKISQKVCMKKSQWDLTRGAGSALTSEVQRKGNLVGNPSGT